MAATAGRKALVKVSGGAVSFTDEACTTVTNYTVFQITNAAKRVWDATATITVKKDTVAQSAALYTVNRLTGTITFLSDIGSGHTVTVSGSYLPLSTAAQANKYDYEITATQIPVPKFGDVYVPRIAGLYDVNGSLGGFKTDTYFSDTLIAGVPTVLEFWSDSSGTYDLRCWALLSKQQVSAVLAGTLDESVSFEGVKDADGRVISG